MASSKVTHLWLKLAASGAVTLALLALLNGLAGLVVGDQWVYLDTVTSRTAAASYGYFAPNQRRRLMFIGIPPYRVTIDALGLRKTKEIPAAKAPGRYRILCVGDSLTFGLFVDDEAAYPYLLQQRLDALSPRFEVLNAGIGNVSITDEADYVERAGLRLDPDLVILYFCSNDLTGLAEHPRPYYQQVQLDADRKLRGAGRFIQAFKGTSLARFFIMLQVQRKYRRFLARLDDPEIRRIYLEKSQRMDDVMKMLRHHQEPIAAHPDAPEFRPVWAQYFATLNRLDEMLKGRRIRLLVVLYPDMLDLLQPPSGYNERMLGHLQRRGVPVLDLRETFRPYREALLPLYNNPPQDFHLSAQGSDLLAREIEGFLRREGLLR